MHVLQFLKNFNDLAGKYDLNTKNLEHCVILYTKQY